MKIEINQTALFENIPQDNFPTRKQKTFNNCVADTLNEILFERKLTLARVQKDTNIPFPTLDDWIKGKSVPLADDNLMVLAKYLNVTLEFLCFGLGQEEARINHEHDPKVVRLAEHFKTDRKVILEIFNGEQT